MPLAGSPPGGGCQGCVLLGDPAPVRSEIVLPPGDTPKGTKDTKRHPGFWRASCGSFVPFAGSFARRGSAPSTTVNRAG